MDKYNVTGMTCAACSARVEKVVSALPNVTGCQVNLLTNSMMVDGTATENEIIEAVVKAGYGASKIVNRDDMSNKGVNGATSGYRSSDSLKDTQTPQIARRLIASVVVLIPLMYLSMGHMMWGWPVPELLNGNHMAITLTELLLATAIMIINQKFFISGTVSAIHGAPNMDTLVALGSAASYIYSIYATYAMTIAVSAGDEMAAHGYMHELYFESAAMILTLITVGKMLESYSKGRTTDAIKSLMDLAPKTANVIRDGVEITVSVDQVKIGDVFTVKPGEHIPVDGIVINGSSAVDESALTGESIPVDKKEGDNVNAATINRMGHLTCKATRVGEDTTLSQIIQMVSDAAATKAPIAKVADKVSGVFVPAVLLIALITVVIWTIAGQTIGYALARGISVLVISCPCALGLATPVAIMVGNGIGAKGGILFKNAIALENAGKADTVVFDKTGTLTSGKPVVTDVIAYEGVAEEELIAIAYAIESQSEHPLAHAVVAYAKKYADIDKRFEISDFKAEPGNGLTGYVSYEPEEASEKEFVAGGNRKFIESKVTIPDSLTKISEQLSDQGKTPVYFMKNDRLLGLVAIADVLKEDAVYAVDLLHKMGKKVIMLTGDNERTAKAIGELAGVDEVIANVLPQDKEEHIKKLSFNGKVVMVGDGINDAPALTRAHVGIAIGAGTDVAIDAADIVLMRSNISDVPKAIHLSRKVLRNIYENLFWAFIYNIIGIPLAAGVWIPIFGWTLNPMFGAAAMSLSSFCVVTNALRLNLHKLPEYNGKSDCNENIKTDMKSDNNKEEEKMTQTLKIEGMMCPHCQAHMTEALNAMEGVTAQVDHTTGTAVVTTEKEYSFDEYKSVVDAAGYTLTEVK